MKKLIPALAMLLVAAALMGTSTFAWFSANKTVTAQGMSVKAVSDGGLVIASYKAGEAAPADADYVTAANVAWSNAMVTTGTGENAVTTYAASVKPTSFSYTTTDAGNGTTTHSEPKWVTATAANADDYAASNGYQTLTIGTAANRGKDNFLLTKWRIKSLDASDKSYELLVNKITVTGGTANTVDALLEQSLRVVIKCGDKYYKFAPNYASGSTGDLYYSNGNARVKETATTLVRCGSGAEVNTLIGSVKNSVATELEVYIYFEGEDENCMSKNAIALNTLSFTITYATGNTVASN